VLLPDQPTLFAPSAGWWVRAVFSGALLVGSAIFTVVLWRRLGRKDAGKNATRS